MKNIDLTRGSITKGLWAFAVPLMLGNVLQQLYNLVDTWVVGKYIGDNALAAVGSSYTLMTFLTSVIIGLSLGTSSFISIAYGKKEKGDIRNGIFMSSVLTGVLTVLIMAAFYVLLSRIILLMRVPDELFEDMRVYLFYVFMGFFATFLYNYISNVLRGMGNSKIPLIFLAVSVVLNVFLDLYFVITLKTGIAGAAIATVISQYISGIGILIYFLRCCPEYRVGRGDMRWDRENLKSILSLSGLTCLQQSMMNFGILLVQGVVNSFGAAVMAAFAVAVKIDTIAYMPVQDFGNAFSVFVAQNFGAGKMQRIRSGIKQALVSVAAFCLVISGAVCIFANPLMSAFVDGGNAETIRIGVQYLRIEGACYIGIGVLFMLYGYYRAVKKPLMSVILTFLSLGTRVLLANVLSSVPSIGVAGIWVSIPIGWALADAFGICFYCFFRNKFTHVSKTVYLTFDDGPGPYTEKLLEVLRKYGVKATFFVTDQFPEYRYMIAEEAKEGHTVGLHTCSHEYGSVYANEGAFFEDFSKIENICMEQTGQKPKIMRFVGGSSNTVSEKYCKGIMTRLAAAVEEKGYRYCDWNVDSGDSSAGGVRTRAETAANVIDGIKKHDVPVALQHDIHSFSVEAVEEIILWGMARGYRFCALDESSEMIHHTIHN